MVVTPPEGVNTISRTWRSHGSADPVKRSIRRADYAPRDREQFRARAAIDYRVAQRRQALLLVIAHMEPFEDRHKGATR